MREMEEVEKTVEEAGAIRPVFRLVPSCLSSLNLVVDVVVDVVVDDVFADVIVVVADAVVVVVVDDDDFVVDR